MDEVHEPVFWFEGAKMLTESGRLQGDSEPMMEENPSTYSRGMFRCAQHGRDLGGESPPVS